MNAIETVIFQNYLQYKEILQTMEAELEQLPKGNITYRTSRGHRYCYLQYWLPEGKPCNQRVQAGDFEKTMALLERRSTLQKNCALLRQHVQTIEAEFPSFIYKEENTIAIVQNHVDAQKPYLTLKGEFVRSKSEVIIANELYTANIPYEYEKPLYLEGYDSPFLPDFTIQVGDKVIYWEPNYFLSSIFCVLFLSILNKPCNQG